MRRIFVGLGTVGLLASMLTAAPAAAVVLPAAVTPATNPAIEETCGLNATLILDASGSIQSAGAVNTVRNAGRDLIAALKDTNSTLRVTQFGTFSGELSTRVPVNASTAGSGGQLSNAMTQYYSPPPPRPAGVNIYNGSQIRNSELTWTNWEDGIKGIDRPELAIFMTDGDPTAYNVNSTRTNVNASSTGIALDNAVTQANTLKNAGSRMLVVGVGSGLTSTASQNRLKQISGPQLETTPGALAGKTINQVDAVAFADFAALGAFLRSVVTSLCGNSVTVQKLAQSSSGAEHLPATGWDVTVQPSVNGGFSWVDPTGPDNSAQTRPTAGEQGAAAFQWKPKLAGQTTTVKVSEAVQGDFQADRWECSVKADDGQVTTVSGDLTNADPTFEFQMNPSDVAGCKLYNDFDYQPGIEITKLAHDDPVRGNAAGWNETYTFTVKNTGNSVLSVNKPVDPQCTSISGPNGPGAGSGKLQPGGEWTYECQAKIGPVATVTTALTHQNTVSVSAVDPKGDSVSAQAAESVEVKTPRINIAKTARRAADGTPIPDGGTVVAGTQVTYVYTLTNTGNDTLNLVRASAVTDDKCAPVTYQSGDAGDDQRLATSETWVYECTKVLNPASTVTSVSNVAAVTATWSNPQDRQQNNGPVTDDARMTINIDRSASLRIVKVTNPGSVDQDFGFTVSGQGVAPGDQSFTLNTARGPNPPQATRNIELDGPDGGGSQYTITEAGASGWDLTGLVCSKNPDSTDPNTGQIKVTVLPEEDVTCTFTNERLPSLTIEKQTGPHGSTADFGFTASSPLNPGTFTLSDSDTQAFPNLDPGQVTITESDVPAGWDLDDITCAGTTVSAKDVDAGSVTVDLAYGENAYCLFTNGELPPASLTIVKDSEPATWDPDFPFDVQGTGLATPGVPGSDSFALGLGESKTYNVHPGTGGDDYTVTEGAQPSLAGHSGFALTGIQCILASDPNNPVNGTVVDGEVTVHLTPGDSAVCTYTNQQKPRLTIVKNVVNPVDPDDSTAFGFTATGLSPGSFSLADADEQVFTDITAGDSLTVTEAAQSGWALTTLACAGQGSGGLTTNLTTASVSGALGYADDVVCTFVNVKQPSPAHLVVMKQTDPSGDPQQFGFTATDGGSFDETFTLTDGQDAGFEVNPGFGGTDYTISEASTPGWRNTRIACTVDANPSQPILGDTGDREVTVTLLPDQVAVCVFQNEKLGRLSVDKVTDEPSPQEFDFTAVSDPDPLDPGAFSLTGGASPQKFTDIPAGNQVSITEDVPTQAPNRWSLLDITCDGTVNPAIDLVDATASFTMGAGDDVDCTYTDVLVPSATVQIVKAAHPADGTEFSFTAVGADGGVEPADEAFTLAPDGDIDSRTLTVHPTAGGEQFTFTESVPDDWDLTDIRCVDGGTPTGTAGADSVTLTVDPGDTVTCIFTNVKDATLTVVKEAPDDPAQAFDFTWDAGADFSLKDQEHHSATGLAAGDYTVAETDLPDDWYLSGPNGAHPSCTGTTANVDYTPELGATVTLAPGEHAVCSFANFFNYDPQIELVKQSDRQVVLQGAPVVYTYTVTNTGNMAVQPVGDLAEVVVDDQCAPVELVSGSSPLAPGDSWTFTCTVGSMTPTKAKNVATATVEDPRDPQETLTSTDEQAVEVRVPALSLVKTVDQSVVYPGTGVVYTYVARNLGATPFEGPQDRDDWLTDDTCASVTYVSGDTGDDSILGVGEAWTYTCAMPISVDTTNVAEFTGVPFIPASPGSGDKQTGEPMTVDDTAQVKVIEKGITITKGASAPGGVMKDDVLLVPAGTEVTYTYQVTSGQATVPMQVLSIVDNRCAPAKYQSGDDDDNGLVDPGETWVYTCKSTFTGTATVTNAVDITAVEPTLGGIATDDSEAVVRSYQGSIRLTKTPSAQVVPKGTQVTYTYQATNDGTVDLTDVVVADDKCAPVTYKSGDDGDGVMQPGEVWVFECASVLQADVTNHADVTGRTPDGGKVTDTATATVLVVGGALTPAIAVTKSPSATRVEPGGKVTYTYHVTNSGTMPLANVRLSDDKCAPVTYVSGDDNGDGLLTSATTGESWPDETWVYTCTTAITKTTTNTVTAIGSPWWAGQIVDKDVSATAQATVRVGRKPLPIDVDSKKECKGNSCTLVKNAKTNKHGKLKYRVKCRPVNSSASGEASFCRTKVTRKGAVKVAVVGYRKVRVTVWVVATPKPGSADRWRPSTWRRSWVIRP